VRPYGTSSADGELDAVLRSEPPVDGATLTAGLPAGRMGGPRRRADARVNGKARGEPAPNEAYLHSGILNMVWRVYGDAHALHRTEHCTVARMQCLAQTSQPSSEIRVVGPPTRTPTSLPLR